MPFLGGRGGVGHAACLESPRLQMQWMQELGIREAELGMITRLSDDQGRRPTMALCASKMMLDGC